MKTVARAACALKGDACVSRALYALRVTKSAHSVQVKRALWIGLNPLVAPTALKTRIVGSPRLVQRVARAIPRQSSASATLDTTAPAATQ